MFDVIEFEKISDKCPWQQKTIEGDSMGCSARPIDLGSMCFYGSCEPDRCAVLHFFKAFVEKLECAQDVQIPRRGV